MPELIKHTDETRKVVESHLRAMLVELHLSTTSMADINPAHLIKIERLMTDIVTHFVYDIKRLMKK